MKRSHINGTDFLREQLEALSLNGLLGSCSEKKKFAKLNWINEFPYLRKLRFINENFDFTDFTKQASSSRPYPKAYGIEEVEIISCSLNGPVEHFFHHFPHLKSVTFLDINHQQGFSR